MDVKKEIILHRKKWEKIGYGSFSQVYRYGQWAIKKIKYIYSDGELKTLKLLSQYPEHKNYCVSYLGAFTHDQTLHLIFNYLEGTDFINRTKFSPEEMESIMLHLLKGLQFLHGHRIVHRDIKPENIRIDTNNFPKILDFGYASFLDDTDNLLNFEGSYIFRSREVLQLLSLRKTKHCFHTYSIEEIHNILIDGDIWALGVSLYEKYNNTQIFPTDKINKLIEEIKKFVPKSNCHHKPIDDLLDIILSNNFLHRKPLNYLIERLEQSSQKSSQQSSQNPKPSME